MFLLFLWLLPRLKLKLGTLQQSKHLQTHKL